MLLVLSNGKLFSTKCFATHTRNLVFLIDSDLRLSIWFPGFWLVFNNVVTVAVNRFYNIPSVGGDQSF